MDIIAEKLGMDPVEFRLKNYARLEDGDQDSTPRMPFTSNGMRECIRARCGELRVEAALAEAGLQPGPVKRGVGMAIHACRMAACLRECRCPAWCG